ncbi:hypothetical protein GCK72_025672 [Caenorhabditis remanei]|uniref:LRRCT domain-containing protein n=1 Tax=Caenorhabditis remanei TaxID=31234 RepID=A0A6A5G3A9_CAERE|nr:hypothetical protein GCK72_025672 [Caenorhabditis remanei]KAF1749205.1 hypothetical protein GCK72_025672 [Caenorhabditis remanei]
MRLLLFNLLLIGFAYSQCPTLQLQEPCTCTSTRYEAVSIVCDGGSSLDAVLESLSNSPPNIDSLTISNTPIEKMPGYAFQGFQIKKLFLRNNGLRSFHPNTFTGNLEDSLEELEVRGNYLDGVPQSGVSILKHLKILSLPDNLIEYVQDNAFLSYHSRDSILKVDLSANNLTAIHPTGLLGLENLSQLSLDKNLLSEIPSQALENVATLEDLSLGVNKIHVISKNALPLPNLKSLSLEVNQIRLIPSDSFEQTPLLSYLYLGNNLLTAIDASMFHHIGGLKINSIDDFAFSQLPMLVSLDLSSNRLETLPSNVIYDSLMQKKTTPVQRKLSIQNNPWRCDKDLLWLRKWLRENGDVTTTSNNSPPAKCWTPSNLSGLDLRQTDSKLPLKTTKTPNHEFQVKNQHVPNTNGTSQLGYQNPHTEVNGLALVGLILGIVLIVFVSCIVLGYLMRFIFLSYESKTKPNVFGSTISSAGCIRNMYGGDGTLVSEDHGHPSTANNNVYLNRPRHWWF